MAPFRATARSARECGSRSLAALCLWLACATVPVAGSVAAEVITFAGYGGTYQRDIVKALM